MLHSFEMASRQTSSTSLLESVKGISWFSGVLKVIMAFEEAVRRYLRSLFVVAEELSCDCLLKDLCYDEYFVRPKVSILAST